MKKNGQNFAAKNEDKSFIQKAISAGMSLYANKDQYLNKYNSIMSNVNGVETQFNFDEVKEKFTLLGRMIKSVTKGEYRDVSPVFLLKAAFAASYLSLGKDFIPDNEGFLGKVDDIAVLSWAISGLMDELNKYQSWEKNVTEPIDYQVA